MEKITEGRKDYIKIGRLIVYIVKKKEAWTKTMHKIKYFYKHVRLFFPFFFRKIFLFLSVYSAFSTCFLKR